MEALDGDGRQWVDQQLEGWRQGDCVVGEQWFLFRTDVARPVFVGVTYTDRNGNSDGITDHWVVIDSRVGDGRYSFFDPGTSTTEAAGSDENVFAWDGEKLQNEGVKKYIVSWVRPNVESLEAWTAHWTKLQEQG